MEKKKIIMEKALELFAEKGFSTTSVQEITERSGISKGAFYLSFKSKDELILALIHKFLQEFIADIDRLVSESEPERLLYRFYECNFKRFSKQSGFAKVFIKEQTHFLNEDFFTQIIGYNEVFQDSVLKVLEKVYGEKVEETKYDLVYTIQGLMKSYMELLLFGNLPLDIKVLSQSLVEKTDTLANQKLQPVITVDLYQMLRKPAEKLLTVEFILEVLEETIGELEDPIVKESLLLLKEELESPSLKEAVIVGLLKNIQNHPSCKRIAYLFQLYFNEKEQRLNNK